MNKVVCYEKSGLSLSEIKTLVSNCTIAEVITAIEKAIAESEKQDETKEAKAEKEAKAKAKAEKEAQKAAKAQKAA